MISVNQDLLFLNLSRKAKTIWKRFKLFQDLRDSYKESQVIGFYPSRDLHSESTWSIYEILWEKDRYTTVIWDYFTPAERNLPQRAYFEMRPEFTSINYRPVHHYQTDHRLIASIKKLHPKLLVFMDKESISPME